MQKVRTGWQRLGHSHMEKTNVYSESRSVSQHVTTPMLKNVDESCKLSLSHFSFHSRHDLMIRSGKQQTRNLTSLFIPLAPEFLLEVVPKWLHVLFVHKLDFICKELPVARSNTTSPRHQMHHLNVPWELIFEYILASDWCWWMTIPRSKNSIHYMYIYITIYIYVYICRVPFKKDGKEGKGEPWKCHDKRKSWQLTENLLGSDSPKPQPPASGHSDVTCSPRNRYSQVCQCDAGIHHEGVVACDLL